MATFTVNCDGSANSFENNGNIRVTYTAGNGSVTITEIEGMRSDGYSSYEDAPVDSSICCPKDLNSAERRVFPVPL